MNISNLDDKKEHDLQYRNFQKLIRSLRRKKDVKINSKKIDNNISKG